jgi:hypothetical protein
MADEQPSLHIDTDWKKQAQEEKRKLAEQEAAKKAQQQAAPSPLPGAAAPPGAAPGAAGARAAATGPAAGRIRDRGQVPQASFGSLVQSLLTQVLFYLGDLSPRGMEPQVNLDMAKYNIDLLGVLEEKTKGNLTEEEQRLLDSALYEARMRYVSVASQYATV